MTAVAAPSRPHPYQPRPQMYRNFAAPAIRFAVDPADLHGVLGLGALDPQVRQQGLARSASAGRVNFPCHEEDDDMEVS